MGDIRNEHYGEVLRKSLLARCGKCPECGHYLTIKTKYHSKCFDAKEKCIFCDYEKDISDFFNKKLGLEEKPLKTYPHTGKLKNAIALRDALGTKYDYSTTQKTKKFLDEVFEKEDLGKTFWKREGNLDGSCWCGGSFSCFLEKNIRNKRLEGRIKCRKCGWGADITDYIGWFLYKEDMISWEEMNREYDIIDKSDCRKKWIGPNVFGRKYGFQ